jgi:hypothetical protein
MFKTPFTPLKLEYNSLLNFHQTILICPNDFQKLFNSNKNNNKMEMKAQIYVILFMCIICLISSKNLNKNENQVNRVMLFKLRK